MRARFMCMKLCLSAPISSYFQQVAARLENGRKLFGRGYFRGAESTSVNAEDRTQNPALLTERVGSTPTSGTNFHFK
jgi:hypothetical protein